jgi:hypothetical protein
MSFTYNWFAIAGLAAAAGPILIHLLNRRRYKVISWAAMDFLRQAVRRSRRIMQLRDLILLLLRTACVILFGLALAQPFLTSARAFFDRDQPVHTVLLIDNSLSMSYNRSGKSSLETAKAAAKEFIERLPSGSRISIVPVCGSAKDFSATGYATKADALEALGSIEVVDREVRVPVAVSEAVEACKRVDTLRSKQVVLISDQQARNWPSGMESELKRLPCPLQIVQVGSPDMENTWIDDFHLQDGIGDVSTPGLFMATVRHQGPVPRSDVQVSLAIDGVTVATQSVDLQPDQRREVVFPPYSFDVAAEPGKPVFVTAEVSLNPPDHLAIDDHRFLVVPVVSSLPVVFVDQHGADEDRNKNRFGETFHLRRLLAPVTAQEKGEKPLVQVQHVGVDRLDRDMLSDARLVVIAGVGSPRADVPLLREYVQQGGSLVICAGGDFDPVAWNELAWQDGLGILPVPLKPEAVGQVPGSTNRRLPPFQIDFDSLHHDYFLLEQSSREDLRDLYQAPYFFKAIDSDASETVKQQVVHAVTEKLEKDRKALAEIDQQLQKLAEKEARGSSGAADAGKREQLRQARAEIKPQWLTWANYQRQDEDLASRPDLLRPEVLASFDNQVPFMVQRKIGRGRVLFVSTGVLQEWNTLPVSHAMLIFDRIFRRMLQESLPARNLASTGRVMVPVNDELRRARFTLTAPSGREEAVSVDALSSDRYGITLANVTQRGIYRLTAYATKETPQAAPDSKLWTAPLAVNGPAGESDLKLLDERGLAEKIGQADYLWTGAGQTISLARAQIYGQDFWEWLILAVIAGGLLELAILALSSASAGIVNPVSPGGHAGQGPSPAVHQTT